MFSDHKPSETLAAQTQETSIDPDDTAIRVTSLSKCYQIYESPRERLKQFVLPRLKRMAGRQPVQYFREFWALKDVSFEVKKGETIGIIGRNGSGKSTLLQMICGTLHPTSGSIRTSGRIAALLELGSGFNPEFTGRENVYLNATILGLSKSEIDARFNDITAFADIGEFIDQPVKVYSSGMVLRLAFAVIAHVDADILIVDEALAVGDAAFTQKCMRFIRKFKQSGTLLFVSHDSASVINLCEFAIWLDSGKIAMHGPAKAITEAYLQVNLQQAYGERLQAEPTNDAEIGCIAPAVADAADQESDTGIDIFESIDQSNEWKSGAAEIRSVRFITENGARIATLSGGEPTCLLIEAKAKQEIYSPILGFFVKDRLGQSLFGENTFAYVNQPAYLTPGQTIQAVFKFRLPLLQNGDYAITVAIAEGTPDSHVQHHWVHDAVLFNVAAKKQRHGLTGIPFESVSIEVSN